MRTATIRYTLLFAALSVAGCGGQNAVNPQAVLAGYRTLAHLNYTKAYQAAGDLQVAIAKLDANPSASTLEVAREAWRAARVPYARSEALRFGNRFVDEWQTRVNAWPVDEGFIDYVARGYSASPGNRLARLNLIASERVTIAGSTLNTEPMRRMLLQQAQALSSTASNVATGYHAIEFMLWGQDLNGTGHGAGQRPWTDFAHDAATCTDGPSPAPLRHCNRRRDFLRELVALLRLDLRDMAGQWGPQTGSQGDRLVEGDPNTGLRRMLHGLVTMSGRELAGQRMQRALLTHAQEFEQDAFSDDTHNSLFFNAQGIENFYYGRAGALDMPVSLADLALRGDADLAQQLDQAFARTRAAMQSIVSAGERGQRFDMLIAAGNREGAVLVREAIAALQAQALLLKTLGEVLELGELDSKSASG